jgi:hypothetical protein
LEYRLPWPSPINTFKTYGDVGPFEVRSGSKDWYWARIRDDDPDEQIVIWLVGIFPHYRIVGWIYAGEGKRLGWYGDITRGKRKKSPCWWVEQHHLNPMSDFIREEAERWLRDIYLPNNGHVPLELVFPRKYVNVNPNGSKW